VTDSGLPAPQDAALQVEGLAKSYRVDGGANRVVDGIEFHIEPGHFYSLLGPSGCGKTTTLRCVAGLERADEGEIRLAGTVVAAPGRHVPTEQRDFGMVFQNYAIWPHLTVFENVAFPLRVGATRLRRPEISQRVDEALALVRLDGLADRSATQLSGGQQQRLALARALVRRPALLLLDEPLSNLDLKLREQMRGELRELQRRLGLTTLYVTHDQGEALSMSNRIAVMHGGRIEQEGTAREIYQRPTSRFVADFVGRANFVDAEVVDHADGGLMNLRALGHAVAARCPGGVRSGDQVTLSIRPEAIRVHDTDPQARNVLTGTVTRVEFLGEFVETLVSVGGVMLVVRHEPLARPQTGDSLWLELRPEVCMVLTEHGVTTGDQSDVNTVQPAQALADAG
jgi:iron(III) transport system ATP-binding protein